MFIYNCYNRFSAEFCFDLYRVSLWLVLLILIKLGYCDIVVVKTLQRFVFSLYTVFASAVLHSSLVCVTSFFAGRPNTWRIMTNISKHEPVVSRDNFGKYREL